MPSLTDVSRYAILVLAAVQLAGPAAAAAAEEREVFRFADPGVVAQLRANDDGHPDAVSWKAAAGAPGIQVTCRAGEGYPGVKLLPAPALDLSAHAHLEARVENLGDAPIYLVLRVDGGAEGAPTTWNENGASLPPRSAGTVQVVFGTSWGKPGHPLGTNRITQIGLYIAKPEGECRFRVESLVAGGIP